MKYFSVTKKISGLIIGLGLGALALNSCGSNTSANKLKYIGTFEVNGLSSTKIVDLYDSSMGFTRDPEIATSNKKIVFKMPKEFIKQYPTIDIEYYLWAVSGFTSSVYESLIHEKSDEKTQEKTKTFNEDDYHLFLSRLDHPGLGGASNFKFTPCDKVGIPSPMPDDSAAKYTRSYGSINSNFFIYSNYLDNGGQSFKLIRIERNNSDYNFTLYDAYTL